MSPMLATEFGSEYVHLAAFAIDIDRIQALIEEDPAAKWPFGWELFLTEYFMLGLLEPLNDRFVLLLREICKEMVGEAASGELLGAQLPFAIYDAINRGFLPEELKSLFDVWESVELPEELDESWERPNIEAADLAEACLEVEMSPPLSPTTQVALEDIVELARVD